MQKYWERQGVDTADDLSFDLSMWGTIICLGIAGMALAAAGPSPHQMVRSARALLVERSPVVSRIGEALGLETAPEIVAPEAVTGLPGVLPRQHLLSGGVQVDPRVALLVKSPPLPFAATLPYLRAVSYDIYTGQGWLTSATDKTNYPAGRSIPRLETPGQSMEIAVQLVDQSKIQVYSPGELQRVDRAVRVDRRAAGTADIFGVRLLPLDEDNPESVPTQYRSTAWITPIGEADLRQAGVAYPEDIRRRYLQLPENFPQRVRDLAGRLAVDETIPYDRARAIEAFVRDFPYTLDLPAPPPGRDIADYFLFDLQAGYCDYTATAMVVLARAAGIPARLAIGYVLPPAGAPSDGALANDVPITVVTEDLAHSWPELYFPGWGWVTFEPSGNRGRRDLPAVRPAETFLPPLPEPAIPAPPDSAMANWPAAAAAAVLAACLLLFAWVRLYPRRFTGLRGLTGMYAVLRRDAGRLGVALYPGQTPNELAATLAARVSSGAGRGKLAKWVFPAGEQARQLVDIYSQAQYSRLAPAEEDLNAIRRTWSVLRLRLWLARLLKYLEPGGKTAKNELE
jgi:transglutaminase-like putative cysteine protease